MARTEERPTLPISWVLMVLAIVVTIIFSWLIVLRLPGDRSERQRTSGAAAAPATGHGPGVANGADRTVAVPATGVRAVLTAAGVTVERTLPAMSFALSAGEALDARLPAGAFEGTFSVAVPTRGVRQAHLGVDLRGGSVIVLHRGEVVLSDAAGDEPRRAETTLPLSLDPDGDAVEFRFEGTASGRSALRALWRPVDALVPHLLPSAGAPLLAGAEQRGLLQAQTLGCVSCHRAESPALQARLSAWPAPILGDVGARVRPDWLRAWLRDPHAVTPGTRMPDLAHLGGLPDAAIEDLVHYLVSMGGPIADADEGGLDASLAATGMHAYHTIGCFACHGPLEPTSAIPGAAQTRDEPRNTYAPLGTPADKTTVAQLAAFLADPLASRPGGAMPGQQITELEARALATYLVGRDAGTPPPATRFEIDAERAERGRTTFAAAGCAHCHALGPNRTPVAVTRTAPALDALADAGPRGCLATAPVAGVPWFDLAPHARNDLRVFLDAVAERRTEETPIDALALDLRRLGCTNCHAYRTDRGPEPAVAAYFSSAEEADLGDEGRLPPDLTDAGARLTTGWMTDVLERDARARPYLAARMPEYGAANVADLPARFAAAAGATAALDAEPVFRRPDAVAGRALVGENGLNCIQCHEIAGQPSTGTPGYDLAQTHARLRPEFFSRWLHDPSRLVPGTRMPSFFVGGRGARTEHYGGAAQKQIDAIWTYLGQGEMLPLPDGLVAPEGLEIVVGAEPVVFRSFMKSAGVRAIACGFPEQIHCAFDADRCAIVAAWHGRFLSAAGAWGARGGSETNPARVGWTATDRPPVTVEGGGEARAVYRGYRLDAARRPVFLYDLLRGAVRVRVEEQPVPRPDGIAPGLVRRFLVQGPPGTTLRLRPGPGVVVSGAGSDRVTLPADGIMRFEMEVEWE